jgi:hypothetical protein
MPGIGIGVGMPFRRTALGLSPSLRAKFLYLWTGSYEGDDLLSDLGNEVIAVTGKDWGTSYITPDTSATFAVPDNATFLAADGSDDFWFDDSDVLQQKDHADLIASATLRTFIKYADFEPYNVYAIGILKAGEVLTDSDKIELNRFFKLWAEYWGVLMDSGYVKDNRIGNE